MDNLERVKIEAQTIAGRDQAMAYLRDNMSVITYLATFSFDPVVKLLARFALAELGLNADLRFEKVEE